jgi:hypothetical protein
MIGVHTENMEGKRSGNPEAWHGPFVRADHPNDGRTPFVSSNHAPAGTLSWHTNVCHRRFAGVVNGIACYCVADKRLCFARECSNRSGDAFLGESSCCMFFFFLRPMPI